MPEPSTSSQEDHEITVVDNSGDPISGRIYATSISTPPCPYPISQTPRLRANGDKSIGIELAIMGGVFPRMISSSLGDPVAGPTTRDLESGVRSTRLRQNTLLKLCVEVIRSSKTNILLLFVPVGIPLYYASVHPILSFVVNILAMIPLAGVFYLSRLD